MTLREGEVLKKRVLNIKPNSCSLTKSKVLCYGGYSDKATPVPIPNTAVKLVCADGTARATVWESRTPP